MLRITEASFITSAANISQALPEDLSEIAVIGRSNVGKSSFINSLTNRKNLAKSSSTPGKTRLINFFAITFDCNGEKYQARLVDLPGFGYAKVSKSEKYAWQKSLSEFITKRSAIRLFILLQDARHPDMQIDTEVKAYLESIKRADQEILVIFTKGDKLNQKGKSALKKASPDALLVSNLKKSGIEKATGKIFEKLFMKRCEDG
ncbi:MAG: YihA family ribosome biogenesis GTP-binding protein [Sulfurospirillum sp.]|nr:MAG: YihA family ribosome biogenesis GTP-binding protein [Sulfurospirillum sp.]